jgi:hypothetical protein
LTGSENGRRFVGSKNGVDLRHRVGDGNRTAIEIGDDGLHFAAVIRAQCVETGRFCGVAERLHLDLLLGRHAREALSRSRNGRREKR